MNRVCFLIVIALVFFCHHHLIAQIKVDSVIYLPKKVELPANAVKKGTLKVGNNATNTHCDYEEVVKEAKKKAAAMGGNIVKVTSLISPVFISKCYRIEADVYYVDKISATLLPQEQVNVQENPKDYAILYIYRLADTTMLSPAYDLHLDTSVVCVMRSKARDSIKLYKEGAITLWGKTAHKGSLNMDIKPGKTYYVRCGLTGGQFNTTPAIEMVDEKNGSTEYARGHKNAKDLNINYLNKIH